MRYCAVCGCHSKSLGTSASSTWAVAESNLSFHYLPGDCKVDKKWLVAMDNLCYKDSDPGSLKSVVICLKHFKIWIFVMLELATPLRCKVDLSEN